MSDPQERWERYLELLKQYEGLPVGGNLCPDASSSRTPEFDVSPGPIADYSGRRMGHLLETRKQGVSFSVCDDVRLLLFLNNEFTVKGITLFLKVLYRNVFPWRASEAPKLTVIFFEDTISEAQFNCVHDEIKTTRGSVKNEVLYTSDPTTLDRLREQASECRHVHIS